MSSDMTVVHHRFGQNDIINLTASMIEKVISVALLFLPVARLFIATKYILLIVWQTSRHILYTVYPIPVLDSKLSFFIQTDIFLSCRSTCTLRVNHEKMGPILSRYKALLLHDKLPILS